MTQPFWYDGVRFGCQGSGKCCTNHGEHAFVFLTLGDRRRLAAHFGMRTSSFTRRYGRRLGDDFCFVDDGDQCHFLDGRRCSVYEARPAQCRTWPFWPENMTPRAWQREVVSFCPGVGKGRLHSRAEIERALVESER